jgi:DNA-binding NarL/FixJ family response regulator
VVFDDRRRARELLGRMFAAVPGVHEVISVASADELVRRCVDGPGHVAVVGTQRAVPTGILAIRHVLAIRPGATVVAVGARDDSSSACAVVAIGARGFVGWDASPIVLRSLVHALIGVGPAASDHPCGAGECRVSVELDGLCRQVHKGITPAHGSPGPVAVHRAVQAGLGISECEMDVLRGIARGLTIAEIGKELDTSDNTIRARVRGLFVKLAARDQAHAVAQAYRAGLFSSAGVVRCLRGSSLVS